MSPLLQRKSPHLLSRVLSTHMSKLGRGRHPTVTLGHLLSLLSKGCYKALLAELCLRGLKSIFPVVLLGMSRLQPDIKRIFFVFKCRTMSVFSLSIFCLVNYFFIKKKICSYIVVDIFLKKLIIYIFLSLISEVITTEENSHKC